jgi:hypothetical protein
LNAMTYLVTFLADHLPRVSIHFICHGLIGP